LARWLASKAAPATVGGEPCSDTPLAKMAGKAEQGPRPASQETCQSHHPSDRAGCAVGAVPPQRWVERPLLAGAWSLADMAGPERQQA